MILVNHVSMRFLLGREKITNLKEYLIRKVKRDVHFDEFWALRDVSVQVGRGEVVGVIGLNGAGKSTLLRIVAGVMRPTSGVVAADGRISPLIELGAGFDHELTARENVFLNGAVLGYGKPFLRQMYKEIVEFADLGEFMDVPLKNFSSGMVARLAFSIATLVNPEILLVDEILSVGDMQFQEKCQNKMRALMNGGATVLLVSHNIATIRELCKRVVWLEKGSVRQIGESSEVCGQFLEAHGGAGL